MLTPDESELNTAAAFEELGIPPSTIGRPPLRSGVMRRPRLTSRLLSSADSRLVALTAPAGYGKTTAVQLWAEADERPFAWVQLGPADDDPVFLLRHIAAAMHVCEPLATEVIRALVGLGRPLDTDLLPTLGRSAAAASPMVMVLDDAHVLTSDAALGVVEGLLQHLPDGSQMAVLSRHRPHLHQARRRLEGSVVEIEARDLVMHPDEARGLISAAGIHVSEAEAGQIIDLAEGWPAGLGLSILAIQRGGRVPVDAATRDAAGSVADYLLDEVLRGLDDDMLECLLQSSVLDRISVDLLNEVLGRLDTAEFLGRLDESGNLFLVALDDRHEWFRFHHLVGDALRRRMESEHPLEARALRSKASKVLEARGDVDGAVRQAAAAGESDRVADLALRHSLQLLNDGRIGLLGQWIELAGPGAAERHPSAAIARAWLGIGNTDPTVIADSIRAAEMLTHDGPLPDGSPSLQVAIAAVRSLVAAEGTAGVLRDTAIIRGGGGPTSNRWWGYATCLEGTVASLEGENDRARDLLYAGTAEVAHSPSFEAGFLGVLALIEADDQDLDQADRHARRALSLCADHNLEGLTLVVHAYAAGALLAARMGRHDEYTAASLRARRLLARLGDLSPRSVLRGYLALAQAALALGDQSEARNFAHEATLARRRDPSCAHLNARLDQLTTILGGSDHFRRDPDSLSAAELRVLAYLPSHLSLREIADRLCVSRNTVKSHVMAIYRKLGTSSRTEAVATADQLGLLCLVQPTPQAPATTERGREPM